jgi:hypothetical protein
MIAAMRWTVAFAALGMLILGTDSADAAKKHRRSSAAPALIVCGMTGCFDVPPGCHYEMRPNGNGIVAVVICDRR